MPVFELGFDNCPRPRLHISFVAQIDSLLFTLFGVRIERDVLAWDEGETFLRFQGGAASFTEIDKDGRLVPTYELGEDGDPVLSNTRRTDAEGYAKWLSTQTGAVYRLPSASEWLHAAQAGGKQPKKIGEAIACANKSIAAMLTA